MHKAEDTLSEAEAQSIVATSRLVLRIILHGGQERIEHMRKDGTGKKILTLKRQTSVINTL